MPYMLKQPVRAQTAPFVFFKDLFTHEECKRIIDFSQKLKPQVAKIAANTTEGVENSAKRRTEIFWVEWNAEREWLFSRMAETIAIANQAWWGFHLAGLNEHLQLTHYRGDDQGFYDWHEDLGDNGPLLHRKLSAVILLNNEFEGGDFELSHVGKVKELEMGSMILFPSYKTHRVKPVTSGERWSLVSWVSGPPFV